MRDAKHVIVRNNVFTDAINVSVSLLDVRDVHTTTNVRVSSNLWAHNRTHEIPTAGDHDFDAFYDDPFR